MEDKEPSLKDILKNMSDKLDKVAPEGEKKLKQFKFKIPGSAKVSKSRLKKNFVTVQYIKENGDVSFVKAQIDDGTIDLDGVHRLGTSDFMLNYKGKPMVIIPSWSVKPFSPEENYESTIKEKLSTAGRKLLLAKMKKEAIENKKKMGGGIIIWIILAVVAAGIGYYLLKGGKVF